MSQATASALRTGFKQVRPILSVDKPEAKRRVLQLYKAWHRQIPYIVEEYDIPKSVEQCREKLREEFGKNRHVSDIRVIDMLVIKGQMELVETVKFWKLKGHVMNYFRETENPKPNTFLDKFFTGNA